MEDEIKMKKEGLLEDKKLNIVLILIVVLGLALRLTGIQHGFPFIFHPDEPTIIRSALGIRFDINPKHFDWPHLYIYSNYFLYMIFARFRDLLELVNLKNAMVSKFPLIWNDDLIFYYLTRCFSAILGALTAIPVYLSGKSLFGKKAGVLATLTMVLLPYHVWHSHYALGDVPMAFLLAWGLYFSTLILKSDDRKNYIFAGLFIGFASSTKYNGGLLAITVPIAHFLRIFWARKNTENNGKETKPKIFDQKGIYDIVLSGLWAFAGFIMGTPFALLDFKTFSRTDGPQGAFWQFTNVGSVSSSQHLEKFFTESFGRLLVDTGYVVMPVFFIGLIFLIFKIAKKKMEERDLFLAFLYAVLMPLIWYQSGFKNSRSHYHFIIYPFLAVIFGYFVNFLQEALSRNVVNLKSGKLVKFLSMVAIPLLFSPLLIKSFSNAGRYYAGDTRTSLYYWLSENKIPKEVAVYNDRSLKDIFTKLDIRSSKSVTNFKMYNNALIVLFDPNDEDRSFIDKNSALLDEIKRFDSKGRLGSDIEIYRYSSNNQVSKVVAPSGCCGCRN